MPYAIAALGSAAAAVSVKRDTATEALEKVREFKAKGLSVIITDPSGNQIDEDTLGFAAEAE